jgi:hypothetical protein
VLRCGVGQQRLEPGAGDGGRHGGEASRAD